MIKMKKWYNPNYELPASELKIMRAIWNKNAPISYHEVLGACVSDYWTAELAPEYLNNLLIKGAITYLSTGKYDAVLEYDEYMRYLKRRKVYDFFHPHKSDFPLLALDYNWDEDITEYILRQLDKICERYKQGALTTREINRL